MTPCVYPRKGYDVSRLISTPRDSQSTAVVRAVTMDGWMQSRPRASVDPFTMRLNFGLLQILKVRV